MTKKTFRVPNRKKYERGQPISSDLSRIRQFANPLAARPLITHRMES
jgi:hypothetical protein